MINKNRTQITSLAFEFKSVLVTYFLLAFLFVKAIIMNFSDHRDVGILYLSTKFELDQCTNNGNMFTIIGQEKLKSHTNTQTYIQTETDTHSIFIKFTSNSQTETDTLSKYYLSNLHLNQ